MTLGRAVGYRPIGPKSISVAARGLFQPFSADAELEDFLEYLVSPKAAILPLTQMNVFISSNTEFLPVAKVSPSEPVFWSRS